jgi:hypothetical protein
MDDYRESHASRRASGWTYTPNPPGLPNPEADSIRELHKILFDAPPPPNEDPEKTRWRIMTMLKGLKAEQDQEALAALQQIAALTTCGGQVSPTIEQSPPATTKPPPMAGRLGQVLSWIANLAAAFVAVIGVLVAVTEGAHRPDTVFVISAFAVIAAAIWAAGRGLTTSWPDYKGASRTGSAVLQEVLGVRLTNGRGQCGLVSRNRSPKR